MGRKNEQKTRKVSRSERKARAEMQEATVRAVPVADEQDQPVQEQGEGPVVETIDDGKTAGATTPATPAKAKATKTPEQIAEEARKAAEARAERIKAKAEKAEKDLLVKYPHVESVTEYGSQGPKRVVIRCQEPMTKQGPDGKQVSVCEETREIAVQDLFQVRQCSACAERKVRLARRARAKDRIKEAKALLQSARK